jgi:hypothetical protein
MPRNDFPSLADESNVPPPNPTRRSIRAPDLRASLQPGREVAARSAHARNVLCCRALNLSSSEFNSRRPTAWLKN